MMRSNVLFAATLAVLFVRVALAQDELPASESDAVPADAPVETTVAEPEPTTPLNGPELYRRVLFGTALVINQGKDLYSTKDDQLGTAWVLDEEDCLLITNHHVVEGGDRVMVYFPSRAQGTSFSPKLEDFREDEVPLVGRVIDSKPEKDLAVIVTAAIPRHIHALPLAPAGKADNVRGGVTVKSVGNPGGYLWDNVSGEVRQVRRRDKIQLTPTQTVDALTFDVTSPINPGDSGGAVVNKFGQVIGVVSATYRNETLRGLVIHIDEVHEYVGEMRPWLRPTDAEHFHLRGQNYLEKERFVLALRDFNRAIDMDNTQAVYFCSRGEAHFNLNDYERAQEDLARAVQLDHELADAYRIRGLCYLRTDKYQSASRDFDHAIEIDANFGPAYEGKALVALEQNNLDSAIENLTEAIRHEPTVARYYFRRGQVYSTIASNDPTDDDAFQNFVDSYSDFTKAIREGGESYGYLVSRGNVLRDIQEWQLAEEDYNRAIEMNPRDPDARRQRGLMWQRRRRFTDARDDFNGALEHAESDNDKARLYVDLGNTYLLAGNDDEAEKLFQKAAEHNPRIRNTGRLRDLREYRTRKLYVGNRTNQPIRFYVLFYTKPLRSDDLIWFPDRPGTDKANNVKSQVVEPGRWVRAQYIYSGDRSSPISAQRIRIWGVGETDGKRYNRGRDEDVILVENGSYRAPRDAQESYLYIFDD